MEKFWPLPTDGDGIKSDDIEGDRLLKKLRKFQKEKLHK